MQSAKEAASQVETQLDKSRRQKPMHILAHPAAWSARRMNEPTQTTANPLDKGKFTDHQLLLQLTAIFGSSSCVGVVPARRRSFPNGFAVGIHQRKWAELRLLARNCQLKYDPDIQQINC